jgi:type I restriction enzyme S subunit
MGFEYRSLATGHFQIPHGWTLTTIEKVAEVNEKSITKRNAPANIQYIDIASVNKGKLLNIQELPFEKAPSRARRVVRNKDSLIATVRPNLEHYLFIKEPEPNTIASTGFAVVSAKTADPRFLYYYMTSKPFTAYLTQIAESHTSAYPAINPDVIEKAELVLPTEGEQRAIAHILGSLDDKIKLNRRMNQTLEAMARAIFKSWFVDFEPVRAKAEGRGTGLPDDIAALFPDSFEASELGEIPSGWESRSLYDSAKYINGAAYRNIDFTDEEGALPVVKISELKNGVTGQTKFTRTELDHKFRIGDGDILLSWSGNPDTSIDTFVWCGGPAWLNQHIFRVLPHQEIEKHFIFYLLKYLRPAFAEIARNKQTTGLGHFTARDMKGLMVVQPSEKLLTIFNNFVGPIFDRWYGNLFESNTLASLRDTLLPKLISGELRVANAKKFVEEVRV